MKKYLLLSLLFATTAAASPIDGTKYDDNVVVANSTIYYDETFVSDEVTVVTLNGDCDIYQDIDLWIYDDRGNIVAKSTTNGCYEVATVIPRYTGHFRVVVENKNKPFDTYFNINMN